MREKEIPTLADIEDARSALDSFIVETPIWNWEGEEIAGKVGANTKIQLKLELFQRTGTFKPRGALLNALALKPDALRRGLTAVSAGNHAIAVSYAARLLGTTAKVVMPKSANPVRVKKCRSYGADTLLVEDVSVAFAEAERIEKEEGRFFVHPFEGRNTILGTATLGLEWCRQAPELDAIIVPIGGGGLCAGVATAFKLLRPDCCVYGVEPEGANTMYRSFISGQPQSIAKVNTIADSLGAPYAAPYSMGLCQKFVDEIVLISDEEMQRAMGLLFQAHKLAVEPAGAAATAALLGPLLERLRGRRIGIMVCGTNIDLRSFTAWAIDFDGAQQ